MSQIRDGDLGTYIADGGDQDYHSPRIHADQRGFLQHGELTERIIGCFYDVYNELGHGFLESVTERALAIAFDDAGIAYERQVPVSVWFRGRSCGDFKADLIVDGKVLVELKAARNIDKAHEKQILNYLRATDLEVGLLMNFGPEGPEFKRFAFSNTRKIRVYPRVSAAEKKFEEPRQ